MTSSDSGAAKEDEKPAEEATEAKKKDDK